MILAFCRYFTSYILFTRYRQWPLILAALGLTLSSFALIMLQSTMSGFQANQIQRSKQVEGFATVNIAEKDAAVARSIQKDLSQKNIPAFLEYEVELLLKKNGSIRPVVAHGLEKPPAFLNDNFGEKTPNFHQNANTEQADWETILPRTLAWNMNLGQGEFFQLISPAHYNHLLGEQPRSITLYVNQMTQTDVPEVDSFHIWVRLSALQNLTRQRSINKVRLYGDHTIDQVKFIEEKYKGKATLEPWEQRHRALLWSLSLENSVMLFLFASMTALVGLCITGGLTILYSKVKLDFAGFWILGAGRKQLERANIVFLGGISLATVSVGLISGLLALFLIDQFGGNVFSEQFVDQKIPVNITWRGVALSFIIPCGISLFFCRYSFKQFKQDSHYLEQIRATGI